MKKFICCAIVCVMTFIAAVSPTLAEQFSDVDISTPYRDAIITLSAIGLLKGYEDGTFKPENTVTRAEFTVMVTRALAVDNVKIDGDIFTDVISHYAKYNIRTAYDMGIINGMGDGTFKPDAPVTYEQAVKMIVCMLGYADNAEEMGGYPAGYMKMGSSLGLTGKISMTNSDPAPRGVIAQLIYSALDVKIQNKIILPDGKPSYAESKETLMEGKLKIYKLKGMVTGVADSVMDLCDANLIDGEMAVRSGVSTIVLDHTKFFATQDEAKQYLGYDVTIYYKDDSLAELPTIVAFDTESKKNNTIEFTYDDIESCTRDTLKYEDSRGKIRTLKFDSENLDVVYNGQTIQGGTVDIDGLQYSLYEALEKWLSPESSSFIYGDVKIVDTASDDTINIITINDYDIMVASKTPTTADYRITDKLVSGNYIILNPDDSSYEFTVTRNSSASSITSIAANDVVLIAASLDGTKYKVDAFSKPVTGKINYIDFSEKDIGIADKTYKINDTLIEYFKDKEELTVGSEGTFYIDKFDNVIYGTIKESKAASYAYLVNLTYTYSSDTYYASMIVPGLSNAVKSYEIEDKIKLNGSSDADYDVKLKNTAALCSADAANKELIYGSSADDVKLTEYSQPVKVDISSNKVKGFISLSKDGEINENKAVLARYMPLAKYKYTATNNFNNEFYINSSTVILYVPADRQDKDEYAKMSASTLFKTGESYWVEPYDVNESKTASLVIVYGNSSLSEITKDSPIAIASKSPSATEINDETVHRITMYTSSSISAVTKNAADDKEFEDIEVGDVFQFGYNNKSAMINKKILIKAADVKAKLEAENYDWTGDQFISQFKNTDGSIEMESSNNSVYHKTYVANVLEVSTDENNSFIRVTSSDINSDGTSVDGSEERYTIPSKVKIIRFDTGKNSISNVVEGTTTKLSEADLRDAKYSGRDCSKILIDTVKGEIKYIMIYE